MNNFLKINNPIPKLNFKDVLIVPNGVSLISSRRQVSLETNIPFTMKNRNLGWKGVPIVSSNMDTVTNLDTFDILSKEKYISCFPKYLNEKWLNDTQIPPQLEQTEYYILSCGINDYITATQLIQRLKDNNINVKFLCIDTPNGYLSELQDISLCIRNYFPDLIIIAGNVVTPEITYDLIKYSGVNIVKCGIGSGAVCDTRLKTGVGYPQLSAILECSEAAHEANGYLMSDGGIRSPSDIAKAFAAGADFVMCGNIFAAHKESPGESVIVDSKEYKSFYGMSSKKANEKYAGGLKDYRTSEGSEILVPERGNLLDTIKDINGGLRSACAYLNSSNLDEFYFNSKFIKIL
jgi:GMP reductase